MPFLICLTVLGFTEDPHTGSDDKPCNDSPPSDEYRLLSLCRWHVKNEICAVGVYVEWSLFGHLFEECYSVQFLFA